MPRNADRRQLFQELWYLPRTLWSGDHRVQRREQYGVGAWHASASLNRLNFSFPPDHGARLVTMVLTDPELRADWEAELEEVRTSMLGLRKQLADALRAETGSDRYGFIAEHRGMFSRLGLSEEQVAKLREEHAIYMIGDSRFNVAGLNEQLIPIIAKAIVAVGG